MLLNKGFKLRHIATEYMLMSVRHGCTDTTRAFSLNEGAARLWERASAAQGPFTEEDLVRWLTEEYDVDSAVAAEDVAAMVKVWTDNGIASPCEDM